MKRLKSCVALLFLPALVFAQPTLIKSARIGGDVHKTRLALSVSALTSYTIGYTRGYRTVTVDLKASRLRASLHKWPFKKTLFNSINGKLLKNNSLRLTINTSSPVSVKAFRLKADKKNLARLVFDFYKKKPARLEPTKVNLSEVRDVVVAIDPGHGGKDPGARGARGTQEKMIALSIAKKLQALLNKQSGVKAVLTRKGDYFVSLRGRTRYARKVKADLFIAIHADAYTNRSARGASVYILSERGASSEAARWLAKRENATALVGGVDLGKQSHLVRSMLIDMTQNTTKTRSQKIAEHVLGQLKRFATLHRGYVEHAGFVVLKSPDIPSILVETGFISNRGEELRLRSSSYQARIASAIFSGVRHYLLQDPPKNTVFYALKHGTVSYKVQSGDTLSMIAARHKMQISLLQKMNDLKNNIIWAGQVLRVPKL